MKKYTFIYLGLGIVLLVVVSLIGTVRLGEDTTVTPAGIWDMGSYPINSLQGSAYTLQGSQNIPVVK